MSKYNGWANYETWRINLEVLDGMTVEDFGIRIDREDGENGYAQTGDLAGALSDYVDEVVTADVPQGLALDLALSFINKVDFSEIAEHMIDDYITENV